MTFDAALMALVGYLFGWASLALRRYTDWTQYNYGPLEWRKLWEGTAAVRAKWTAVWVIEGGFWACAAYAITRFIDPH